MKVFMKENWVLVAGNRNALITDTYILCRNSVR